MLFVIPIVSITISIIIIYYFYLNRISVANPSNLLVIGWLFPFALTPLLIFTPYYEDWRPSVYLFLWVNIAYISFILGNLVGYLIKKPLVIQKSIVLEIGSQISWSKFRKHAYFIFILGMIGYVNNVMNVLKVGGLAAYEDIGGRGVELAFGASTIFNYLYFLNILTLMMFVCLRYINKDKYYIDLFIILTSVIALLSHGVKSTIIWPLVMSLVLVHTYKKAISLLAILQTTCFVILVFLLVSLGRQLPSIAAGSENFDDIFFRAALHIPLYFSSGFVNFEIELDKYNQYSLGLNLFAPFYEVMTFITGNRESLTITEATEALLYNNGFNTATYLRDPYRDFGVFGIVIFSFFYGFISSLLFGIASRTRNPYYAMIYAVYAAAIFGMFFSNHFQKVQYIYIIFVCFLLGFLNRKKSIY